MFTNHVRTIQISNKLERLTQFYKTNHVTGGAKTFALPEAYVICCSCSFDSCMCYLDVHPCYDYVGKNHVTCYNLIV